MVIYNSYDERLEIHENDIVESVNDTYTKRKINSAVLNAL